MREERAQYGRRDWEGGKKRYTRRKERGEGKCESYWLSLVHLPAERKGGRQNQMSSFGKRATAAPLTYLAQGPLWLSPAVPPQRSSKFIMSEIHPTHASKGALDWNLGTHQSLGRRDEADVMSHQMLKVKRGWAMLSDTSYYLFFFSLLSIFICSFCAEWRVCSCPPWSQDQSVLPGFWRMRVSRAGQPPATGGAVWCSMSLSEMLESDLESGALWSMYRSTFAYVLSAYRWSMISLFLKINRCDVSRLVAFLPKAKWK